MVPSGTFAAALGLTVVVATGSAQAGFEEVSQTNLVTDGLPGDPVTAPQTDPNLINPWGISSNGMGGPLWISDNGTGLSSIYAVTGSGSSTSVMINAIPPVTIFTPPGQTTPAAPDGQVFVGGRGFNVTNPGNGQTNTAAFLFATEDGTISGLSFGVGDSMHSFKGVDNSKGGAGAVYKGLAVTPAGSGTTLLYAANFRAGTNRSV